MTGISGWILKHLIPGGSGISTFFNDILGWLGDVFDVHLWESLGWIVLGFFLMITGLIYWMKKPIGEIGGAAARGFMAA
jgi:uncharacterized membrane protein YeaQ/YmgE (transglycosylase-associated protein family)